MKRRCRLWLNVFWNRSVAISTVAQPFRREVRLINFVYLRIAVLLYPLKRLLMVHADAFKIFRQLTFVSLSLNGSLPNMLNKMVRLKWSFRFTFRFTLVWAEDVAAWFVSFKISKRMWSKTESNEFLWRCTEQFKSVSQPNLFYLQVIVRVMVGCANEAHIMCV